MSELRRYDFDTIFDGEGRVVAARAPVRRSYGAAEVEAMLASARLEAREQALREAEGVRAHALATIADSAARALPELARVAAEHRAQAADLAQVCAGVIAGEALARTPQGAIMSALESLSTEILDAARLVIRAGSLDDQGRAEVEAACAAAGFGAQVVFRDLPGAAPAAFVIEWPEGRASFDPASVAARIRDAVTSQLAAEAAHAESLNLSHDGAP